MQSTDHSERKYLPPLPTANMVPHTSFTSDRNRGLNHGFFLFQRPTKEQWIQHLFLEALKESSFTISNALFPLLWHSLHKLQRSSPQGKRSISLALDMQRRVDKERKRQIENEHQV